jgi:hypothetical protein
MISTTSQCPSQTRRKFCACTETSTDIAIPRFGNFIGEDVESEEASEVGAEARDYAYDDEEPEQDHGVTGQELMEIDGM